MRSTFLLAVMALGLVPLTLSAQDCIDPSLIDPLAICPFIWDPVCGCDGVTYSNECVAVNTAGVTDWTPGECGSTGGCIDPSLIDPDAICLSIWDPVCGCDGVTYGNDCEATNYGGVTSWTPGECGSTGGCIDPEQIDPTQICPLIFDPVCGCDGVEYGNDCQAYYGGGVTSWIPGPCGSPNNCSNLWGEDFGPCDLVLGYGMVLGECVAISGCSTTTDLGADHSLSIYPTPQACLISCGDPGDCLDLGGIDFGDCEMIMGWALINGACELVSGCGWEVDDIDYADWSYATEEACMAACGVEPPGPCIDLEGVDFGDCDFPLGICNIGGTCMSISGCDWTVNYVDYSPFFYETMDECEASCADYTCEQPDLMDPEVECQDYGNLVCGCDGYLYWSPCDALYYNGITGWTPGFCEDPAVCVHDEQIDLTVPCPLVLDPVCGCDSVTYGNSCEAYYWGGVQSWEPGACQQDTGMTVIELEELQLAIVPNPVGDQLRLLGSRELMIEFSIRDLSGREVMQGEFLPGNNRLSVGELPQGAYLMRVQEGMRSGVIRFIKD